MEKSYTTIGSLIAHIKENIQLSNGKEADMLESILVKQKVENKDALIVPLFIQSYSLKEKLHLLHYYMNEETEGTCLESQYYCGEPAFELILSDNSRLFNASLYKGTVNLVKLTTVEQVNQELEENGVLLVAFSMINRDEMKEIKRWMTVKKEEIVSSHHVLLGKQIGDLHQVLTASEASLLWGFERSVVRKAIERGRFMPGEARKSEGTWMVTYRSMQRVFGSVPNVNQVE